MTTPDQEFVCQECGAEFDSREQLDSHNRTQHAGKRTGSVNEAMGTGSERNLSSKQGNQPQSGKQQSGQQQSGQQSQGQRQGNQPETGGRAQPQKPRQGDRSEQGEQPRQ